MSDADTRSGLWTQRLWNAIWLLLFIPGIAQFCLLASAMLRRWNFPYDLEWMEGGLLIHAQRLADGAGIYVAPSIEFIPFLYTPLYPAIIAFLGSIVGIGYAVGRAVSILSTFALCFLFFVIIVSESENKSNKFAWLGASLSVGFFAATYPWVEGWYDLVRADSLFMLFVVVGLFGIRRSAKAAGSGGTIRFVGAAAILALSFFTKQTGVFFVAVGTCIVLPLNWRRIPLYLGVTGTIGLGGTWLLNQVSGGWFWIYIYQTHQNHAFSMDRFTQSFSNILWQWPAMTLVIAIGLASVVSTRFRRTPLSPAARGLALWSPVYALAVIVGAVGWGTQFAHFNAYIPAMFFGSLCAGLAVPATIDCVHSRFCPPSNPSQAASVSLWPQLAGVCIAVALGIQLFWAWWSPDHFVPARSETNAGRKLIQILRDFSGDILIPYHPWYAKLAGKKTYAHLMGLRDMSTGKRWTIDGLDTRLSEQQFSAIVIDNRPIGGELRGVKQHYRLYDYLPKNAAPHVFTGAGAISNPNGAVLIPRTIWIPDQPSPQIDAQVLWNFETGRLDDWTLEKPSRDPSILAWGIASSSHPVPNQGPVLRFQGRKYLSSFHHGDSTTGTLRSPIFTIKNNTISFLISGGKSEALRVELHVKSRVVQTATGTGTERMKEVHWNVSAYVGHQASVVLVDDDTGPWGHLNVDEFLTRAEN